MTVIVGATCNNAEMDQPERGLSTENESEGLNHRLRPSDFRKLSDGQFRYRL